MISRFFLLGPLAGAVVASELADAGRRRGRAPPGGCAEPDGRRPREGVLGREPGRVGGLPRRNDVYLYAYLCAVTRFIYTLIFIGASVFTDR